MNNELTENQKMIADMVRDFGEREIKPHFMEWDESQHFPIDTMKKMGELGLLGVLVPESYGGSGFGYLEYYTAVSAAEELCATGLLLDFTVVID